MASCSKCDYPSSAAGVVLEVFEDTINLPFPIRSPSRYHMYSLFPPPHTSLDLLFSFFCSRFSSHHASVVRQPALIYPRTEHAKLCMCVCASPSYLLLYVSIRSSQD